jgi:basic amino acid/polyamine antiporter, APA family
LPPERCQASEPTTGPRRELTLFDSTCIIVGIIVGSSIYLSGPMIAGSTPNVAWLMVVWLLGALFSLIGALCYAELGTAYPREGGDYVYLTEAFGRAVGFLFGWCQLWIIRPGSVGAMAFVFAEYANQIWPKAHGARAGWVLAAYAAGSVAVLSAIHLLGIRQGKGTQNVLTVAKVVGLTAIVLVGLAYAAPRPTPAEPIAARIFSTPFPLEKFSFAMIFVLFAFGGWNEMAYVGAEVKEPRKNILRALLIGTLAVTAIYVLVMLAFVHAVGLAGARQTTVAADVLRLAIGDWAGTAISLLICVSALGAVNGQIFTGARIYYAMGVDHRLYRWLGRWNARRGTPVCSLLVQGAITLFLILWFGFNGKQGFDQMVIFTTPGFWFFLVLVGAALIVLRRREPERPGTYRVIGYPVVPMVFCAGCGFMVYSGLAHAILNRSWEALWSIAVLLIGAVVSLFNRD